MKDGVTLISGSFRIYMEFPDEEELTRNVQDSTQSKETNASGQMSGRKRKKSTEGPEECEIPRPLSSSNRIQKKPAKKPTFSQFLVPVVSCL